MSLSREDVQRIAHLARLGITDADVPGYAGELTKILGLVAQLQDADTSGVEPMAHPLHAEQRLREDSVTETDQHEKFQKIAPATESDLYLVPKVVE